MSTLSNIIADAEKIAPELIPPPAVTSNVVGVLIKHVEALVGKELDTLSEDVLGISPPPPTEAEVSAAADKTELERVQEQLASLTTELNAMRAADAAKSGSAVPPVAPSGPVA